jgi:hypothetical protein
LVDADVSYQAFVENFDGAHIIFGVFRHRVLAVAACTGGVSGGSICDESVNAASTIDFGSLEAAVLSEAGPQFGGPRNVDVADTGVTYCRWLRRIRDLEVGGEKWCEAVQGWRCGVLGARRTEASKPGDNPRSAQDRHCRRSPRVHEPPNAPLEPACSVKHATG